MLVMIIIFGLYALFGYKLFINRDNIGKPDYFSRAVFIKILLVSLMRTIALHVDTGIFLKHHYIISAYWILVCIIFAVWSNRCRKSFQMNNTTNDFIFAQVLYYNISNQALIVSVIYFIFFQSLIKFSVLIFIICIILYFIISTLYIIMNNKLTIAKKTKTAIIVYLICSYITFIVSCLIQLIVYFIFIKYLNFTDVIRNFIFEFKNFNNGVVIFGYYPAFLSIFISYFFNTVWGIILDKIEKKQ